MSRIRIGVAGLLCVAVVGVLGCASNRYKTAVNVDTEYDFSKVDSYALKPQREKAAGSAGGQRVAAALRKGLEERGYREVAEDEADVLVSYDLGRFAPAKLSGSNSFAITEGTLTVSVLDPPSGRVVWYGWVETRLRPNDDDAVIDEAVGALFEDRIPVAPGSGGETSAPDSE